MWILYVKKRMEFFGNANMIFTIFNEKPNLKEINMFIEKANKDKVFGVDCRPLDICIDKINGGDIINFWDVQQIEPIRFCKNKIVIKKETI